MTNICKHLLTVLLLLIFNTVMYAQLEVTSGDTPPFDPEIILENYFFGGGVDILEISYTGADNAVGFFDGENSNIGMDRGIVLTTGDAIDAEGPDFDNDLTMENDNGENGDDDLDDLLPGLFSTQDATVYNIRFIPYDTIVRFNYIWASEEYYDFAPPNPSLYNDVFGFFISGPGINGPYSNNSENIALLPDGVTPVSINTINPISNAQYLTNNEFGQTIEYNAFTVQLEASALVIPCEVYDIKIAVADVGDGIYDSAVFLKSGSFGTDALNIDVNTFSADSIMAEGCIGSSIEFRLGTPAEADFPLDYNIWGTAQNGLDYAPIPLNAFIPAGEDSLTLFLNPIADGMPEDLETIFIDVRTNICTRDTFTIYIADDQLVPPPITDDATICEGESVSYDVTLPIQLPESLTLTNNQTFDIPDSSPANPAISTIEVVGAAPEIIAEGSIFSVCLDITHPWVADLNIYLRTPSGDFLTLSTNNGGSGDNYTQTCFTATANTEIEGLGNTEPPFTGDYLPESSWEEIFGADMNGVWQLIVSDDSNGFTGTLNSWSITIPPIYNIGYLWEPADGVSNPNLSEVDLSPTTTTTYTVTAFDTYGCSTMEDVTVTVIPSLPAPAITCDNSVDGQITFSWNPVAGALSYEVNVNGTGWVAANGGTSHTLTGLADQQIVTIEVRGLDGGPCGTLSATLDCTAMAQDCALMGSIDDEQDADCFGENSGQFTVSASSGAEPYTFEIPGATSTTGTFTDLAADTYIVSITDNIGCTTTESVTIDQPDSLQFSIGISAISCNDGNDASITFTASGGIPDYEYSIDDGINFQTNNTFENLAANTYTLIVSDANGCTTDAVNLEIPEPPALQLMASATPAGCGGAATGTTTVMVSGGTPDYTYLWDANAGNQNTQTALGLPPGMYSVTVTDSEGCVASAITEVTETAVNSITLTASEDTLCSGASANLSASGAEFYEWTPTDGLNNSDIPNPVAMPTTTTTYTVTGYTRTENLIVNGDFEQGNTGFTSEYTYNPVSVVNESTYAVTNSPASVHSGFSNCNDHTTGAGNMMVVNGAVTPNQSIWCQSVSVQANTDYDFSTWITNAVFSNPAILQFSINGELLGPPFTPLPLPCLWQEFNEVWNSGNNTTALICILNQNTVANGNDFLLDDIAFSTLCSATESVTIHVTDLEATIDNITAQSCPGLCNGTATVTPIGGTMPFTYNWSNGENTATATMLCGGTNSVIITDANNCTATAEVNIGEGEALMLTTSATPASCNGSADGTATVTANNGDAPYTYQWDNASGQNGPTAVGLSFGSYSVTVTDANGCQAIDQANVPEESSIEYTATGMELNCFGDANGIATVEVTSGAEPYTYAWNTTPTQSTNIAIGLSADTYTVTITDDTGCSAITDVEITQPDELMVELTPTDPLCAGENGTITSTVTGGTGTYAYTWSNGAPADNTNAPAGTYALTVTDTNGCQTTVETTLNDPAPLSFTATPTAALCNGNADGIITVDASGGTADYSYSLDNINFQNNNIFENLAAGIYTVYVNDANDCSDNKEITVGEAGALTLMQNVMPASCNGGTDGTATITASNGTMPYTYQWDSNASNQDESTAVGLALGTYTVTVTDGNGCEAIEQVNVTEQSSIEYTSDGTELNCFGDANGVATVDIISGTEPYNYLWNTTPAQTTASITDLTSGTYTVTITDGSGCSEIVNIDVTEPDELTVDLLPPTNALCAGAEGAISSNVSGGTGAYTYAWDNGMITADISAVAGTYSLIVTDANGCTTSAQSIINEPAPLSFTTALDNALCNGGTDGTITITASGGTADYSYSLDNINFQNNNVFENLTAGTYTVYVNDINNCTTNKEIEISEADALILTLDATTESCDGDDATATATVLPETGNYTYTWSDGQVTPTANDLSAGIYTVTVTDANGCEITDSVEIISEADIQIGVTATNVSCFGAGDGEASIIADGVQPITYQWSTNTGNQTTPTAFNLSGGTYEVTVTDANDCMRIETVTITEPEPLNISLASEDILCNGTATGVASVAATGGTGTYLYQWDDPDMQQSAEITELIAGTYTITVTDANGCQIEESVTISQPAESVAITGFGSALDCFGDSNGTITVDGVGGSPPYSYSLDNENFTQGNIFIGLAGGDYTVYATDATGECTAQAIITVAEPPEFTIDLGEDIELLYGDSILLEAIPSDSTTNHIYTWSSFSPEWHLSHPDSSATWARPLYQTTYTVTIENENGCTAADDINIFINKEQPVFVANAFTPNGDNVNDLLFVQGGAAAIRVVVFRVYDRWGELIFETRDADLNNKETGWDGSFKGQEMGPAVFVWYTEVEFIDGSVAPYQGEATLIR